MSNPFSDLSDANREQVRKYLTFFRTKKDGVLRALHRELQDVVQDRLHDDVHMYSREEVLDFADVMESAAKAHVSNELGSVVSMGTLAVDQLLVAAQLQGAEITLETAALENQQLISAIDKMSLDAMQFAGDKQAQRNTKLTSFRDEAKAQRDESTRLEDANTRLRAECDSLRRRLTAADAKESQSNSNNSSSSDETGSEVVRRLERELREANEDMEKRLQDTPQFRQLQAEMRNQASKIRDLRTRLGRYEDDSDSYAAKEDD